jgi:hypothetical protein
MWRKGDCASHGLLRLALTDRSGIVETARVAAAAGVELVGPPLPDWVLAWIESEAMRPWPPMQDAEAVAEIAA